VLLFDYRGYGDQPGEVTLGYRELADARAALGFLRGARPGAQLGVIGFSMGAAVAVMLGAREKDVQAVVADSPFTSQREVVRFRIAERVRSLRSAGPLLALVIALVDRQLVGQFGFGLDDVSPLREVSGLAGRPLFLIHGGADEVIPADHTRRLIAAARSSGVLVDEWIVPEAGHCGGYFADRAVYCTRVREFFSRVLLQR
jgi:fermentation-respiration switch protein FrsA (DUF1100 family)